MHLKVKLEGQNNENTSRKLLFLLRESFMNKKVA